MNSDKPNFFPLIVFVAGVGYTLYPALEGTPPRASTPETAIQLKEAWFNPKPGPTSLRNPFRVAAPAKSVVAPASSGGGSALAKPEAVAGIKAARPAAPAPKPEPPEVLGVRLTAVVVGPVHSAAVIDGDVYAVGDRLTKAGRPKSEWRIARISDDRVDLVDVPTRRTVTLEFDPIGDPKAKPAGPKLAQVAAAPAKEMDLLKEVLGPSADVMSPLPPGLTERLGKLIGADLKTGDLGSLEAFLGSATTGVGAPKGGR